MLDAGRHAFDARRLGATRHFIGQRRGGDVDIAGRDVQKRIADGAADHAGFLAIAVEQSEHAGGRS